LQQRKKKKHEGKKRGFRPLARLKGYAKRRIRIQENATRGGGGKSVKRRGSVRQEPTLRWHGKKGGEGTTGDRTKKRRK